MTSVGPFVVQFLYIFEALLTTTDGYEIILTAAEECFWALSILLILLGTSTILAPES